MDEQNVDQQQGDDVRNEGAPQDDPNREVPVVERVEDRVEERSEHSVLEEPVQQESPTSQTPAPDTTPPDGSEETS